ncbi:MAG: Bax inhibitor-1/YccA family protein [Spirochaetes bacterium]|uniref:Bax inhibitor-1/YccA family protein n=1 Tax=Candidatus Ornithospirochaeta stercoravium TaxID=2840897 RepID=A0A9D9NDC5_9SPIO|nr:Bax inhibitor-1/YccA family protein [Candidatus Ornithospirochaeta stercoravium]
MSENKELILRDVKLRENALMKNVYLWMILGLAVTAGIAFFVSTSEAALRFIFLNPIVTIAIFIAQLVLVMVLSGRVERLSTGAAVGTFLGYSALTGVTLSSIFLAYTGTSIAIAFMSALSVFIGGAIYGAVTKKDLRSWGGYLTMGLFGLIIASLLNMLFRSSGLDLIVSVIGVVLFTGLTAWDSQRVSDINREYGPSMTSEELTKLGILGALSLYLDFLNIFLYLVRIVGRSDN